MSKMDQKIESMAIGSGGKVGCAEFESDAMHDRIVAVDSTPLAAGESKAHQQGSGFCVDKSALDASDITEEAMEMEDTVVNDPVSTLFPGPEGGLETSAHGHGTTFSVRSLGSVAAPLEPSPPSTGSELKTALMSMKLMMEVFTSYTDSLLYGGASCNPPCASNGSAVPSVGSVAALPPGAERVRARSMKILERILFPSEYADKSEVPAEITLHDVTRIMLQDCYR
jgi:hypothetical protein